jgi:predicted transcriptional regulator
MLYKQRMSTKEVLLEVAEKLPPDATLVDAIYELEFRQAVEDGLASLDRGERIPLEEARKRIPQWTSQSSSPPAP